MSPRSALIVVLALLCGGSAAYAVRMVVLQNRGSSSPALEMGDVVVAAVGVSRGEMLTPDLVKQISLPKGSVPAGAIFEVEAATDRVVLTPLVVDEPVLEGKLAAPGTGAGIRGMIGEGMRSFTINIPDVSSGVAGFVQPSDRVDVLLTMEGNNTDSITGGSQTTSLLQNIEVLAVDRRLDSTSSDSSESDSMMRSVTLHVTPEHAKTLSLAQSHGTLHLSLRNPRDVVPDSSRPVTVSSLWGRQEVSWDERAKGVLESLGELMAKAPAQQPVVDADDEKPVTEPPPPRRYIRTIRGTQMGAVSITTSPNSR